MKSVSELAVGFVLAALVASTGACGMSRYVKQSKMAEARNYLGLMSKSAAAAYDREKLTTTLLAEPGGAAPTGRGLCGSAKNTVPASIGDVAAKKYMSAPADWSTGSDTEGWKCLKFSIDMPQYYMYGYKASGRDKPGDSFTGTANGDLDGNGKQSTLQITGTVDPSGSLVVAPALKEIDPEE